MFCAKCGSQLQEGGQFCPACGQKVGEYPTQPQPQTYRQAPQSQTYQQAPRVMLNPAEVVPQKQSRRDSSNSLSGQGKTIGLILIILSIIIDLVAAVTGLFPIIAASTVVFIIGILLCLFCP